MEPSSLSMAAAAATAVAAPYTGRYAVRRFQARVAAGVAPAFPWPAAGEVRTALYLAVRRALDVTLSAVLLVLLAPVFALVALLVRLDSAGPVLHRRRVLHRQPYDAFTDDGSLRTFDALKFRTMRPDADDLLRRDPALMARYLREFKLDPDPRVTRIGRLLRVSSLDELPQLVNVLRGQMSLVGPRIITPPELDKYGEHAARYLSVKPGLTGWWQVSGRAEVSYPERVRLDMWYVEHRSLRLDLVILWRTVGCVLRRRGAV
jgi:lipopolysaccharide/colanic/teichoic acid biosynthesis glycosyltransferase